MPSQPIPDSMNLSGLSQSDLFSAAQLVQRKIVLSEQHQITVRDSETTNELPLEFKQFSTGNLGWTISTKLKVSVEVPDHSTMENGLSIRNFFQRIKKSHNTLTFLPNPPPPQQQMKKKNLFVTKVHLQLVEVEVEVVEEEEDVPVAAAEVRNSLKKESQVEEIERRDL
ncbi:uncharacterized protein JCM6883_002977 [Sporobolomyces salmoneus]|uniref:uncharacterized protein n=1 Tax=Sporobolomyces salmoneus TaxID=183962 RepID=UPI003170BA0A